jgi:hypothetical protein
MKANAGAHGTWGELGLRARLAQFSRHSSPFLFSVSAPGIRDYKL